MLLTKHLQRKPFGGLNQRGKTGSQWATSGQKTLVTIPAKLFVIIYKLIYFLFPEGFKNIL
jgi:hypothetical protein